MLAGSVDSASYTKRESPISLNEKGEELLKKSGADKFVLSNKDELIDKIKQMDPQTAYDVQLNARKIIESLADDSRFIDFKNFMFKESLNLEPIFIVMSIYLRDIALPLLGFTYEQLDKEEKNILICPFCNYMKIEFIDDITGNNSYIFNVFRCNKCKRFFFLESN